MFLSERESSMPTMIRSVDASIDAITSEVKPGGVSTITKSFDCRRSEYASRISSVLTALAWSGRLGASSAFTPDACLTR